MILRKVRSWILSLRISLASESWREWRTSVALSVVLSAGILAVVLTAGIGGKEVAAAPPADGPTAGSDTTGHDGGVGAIAVSRTEAGVLAPAKSVGIADVGDLVSITGHTGPCDTCSGYDPDMGYFEVNVPPNIMGGADGMHYVFARDGVNPYDHGIDMGVITGTQFLFWLHRSKGCGDFSLYVSVDNPPPEPRDIMIVGHFHVKCYPNLAPELLFPTALGGPLNPFVTVSGATPVGSNSLFSPAGGVAPSLGVIGRSAYDAAATDGALGLSPSITIEVQNPTATWMDIEVDSPPDPSLGPGSVPSVTLQVLSPVQLTAPGQTVDFQVATTMDWGQTSQDWMASASPVNVTSTLVFSVGPTAQVSHTLVITRPLDTFLPVSERQVLAGW